MVIKWTPLAIEQLQNFIKMSKAEPHNIKDYISSLVEFANNLLWSNDMGKVMLMLNNVKFRQLLYKKHRIIYYVKNDEIQIVSVIHTSQNLDKAIAILEKYYKNYL